MFPFVKLVMTPGAGESTSKAASQGGLMNRMLRDFRKSLSSIRDRKNVHQMEDGKEEEEGDP
jgi:hypothetical protein